MYSSIISADVRGIHGVPIRVETDVTDGMPTFIMVGYLTSAVKEAADRVRTALKNFGIKIPAKRITVNLSPADVKKEGSGFDLAIAVSLMESLGIFDSKCTEGVLFLGELGLDGTVKSVHGTLPVVEMAAALGCRACVVPKKNEREGRMLGKIPCIGVENLKEVMELVCENSYRESEKLAEQEELTEERALDFSEIRGQESVVLAAEIAAAGMLNLLMIGPPGSGKTMIARRIPTILPKLSREESLELTKIYSVCGLLPEDGRLMTSRPFRSPHHTISASALVGGGRNPMPGEISLANFGCLMMDEITEVPKNVLEALRQPLEDQQVQISRTSGNYLFPAKFMLVAAMNPCNCGYYPDMNRCHCSTKDIHRYLNKISMPFIDRMDLCVEVPAVAYEELTGDGKGKSSKLLKEEVARAHDFQKKRYEGTPYRFNSDLRGKAVEEYCAVGKKEQQLLKDAFSKLHLTARSYHRLLRVARTAADLDGSVDIAGKHILQAICYRNVDRKFWMY